MRDRPARVLGKATRDAYGETLAALGHENPRIVALDADLSKSTKSVVFAKAHPDRFFNLGIQEANMVGVAAGMATTGLVPFASSFATFLMSKAFDQMRMAVANPRLNVKLVGSHAGISIGEDGASQMGVEDLALACALPGFTVLVPADGVSASALTRVSAEHQGPVFLRTGRAKAIEVYDERTSFRVGGSVTHHLGRDANILACGLMVAEALEAAFLAREEGFDVGVVDLYSLKPVDAAAIEAAASASGRIVVAEEHLHHGGLGSIVAQVLAERHPARMVSVDLGDRYAESGTPEAVLEAYGMTSAKILAAIRQVIRGDLVPDQA